MIIYEDKSYMQCSEYPDTLFDENAKYVIPDNTELAQKYIEYYSNGWNPTLIIKDNEIIDIQKDDSIKKQQEKLLQIKILKSTLESEDYKIIKCYEASLTGKTLPYDIEALVAKRDEIRKEINDLEN